MEKKEFVITTAKEIILKAMEGTNFSHMLSSNPTDPKGIDAFGHKLKALVKKIEEAYESIKIQ